VNNRNFSNGLIGDDGCLDRISCYVLANFVY